MTAPAVGACAWCEQVARLTATERGALCPPCIDAYLDEAAGERRVIVFGEQYRRTPVDQLPVTPTSRGHVESAWTKRNERVAAAARRAEG
jgi:hypothetical protein